MGEEGCFIFIFLFDSIFSGVKWRREEGREEEEF